MIVKYVESPFLKSCRQLWHHLESSEKENKINKLIEQKVFYFIYEEGVVILTEQLELSEQTRLEEFPPEGI